MKTSHLTLIPKFEELVTPNMPEGDRPPRSVMAPSGYQWTLPFNDESCDRRIVVVAMDNLHGVRFCDLVLNLKPRIAVDLRHLIRFDLPGTCRTEIFGHFSATRTMYVKASIPWHKLELQDFIADDASLSQRLNHEVVEQDNSPILLMTSKEAEVRYLLAYLHRFLSSVGHKPWTVEHVN